MPSPLPKTRYKLPDPLKATRERFPGIGEALDPESVRPNEANGYAVARKKGTREIVQGAAPLPLVLQYWRQVWKHEPTRYVIHRYHPQEAPQLDADHALRGTPLPGDVVRLAIPAEDIYFNFAGDHADGIIGGIPLTPKEEYGVTFCANAHRSDRVVSCSGGPTPLVSARDLKPTGLTKLTKVWKWNGPPKQGAGAEWLIRVPVWSWTPKPGQL